MGGEYETIAKQLKHHIDIAYLWPVVMAVTISE